MKALGSYSKEEVEKWGIKMRMRLRDKEAKIKTVGWFRAVVGVLMFYAYVYRMHRTCRFLGWVVK